MLSIKQSVTYFMRLVQEECARPPCSCMRFRSMKITPFVLSSAISSLLIGSAFSQAPARTTTAETPAQAGSAPTERQQNEVGVSSRDGITMSGEDVLVTRNGISEKLTKRMELPNGVRVEPNGTITLNGEKLSLRPTQVLTFEGRFLNIPIRESATQAATTTTTTTNAAPATTIVVPQTNAGQAATSTAAGQAAATERATTAQREAERMATEEERRRQALKESVPPKAGEGSQR